MKLSGWIFMLLSWGIILSMAIFCFGRVFKKDSRKKTKGNKIT